MRIAPASLLALSILALPLAGCGSPASGQARQTVPVKGKVTYRGQPLRKGTVRFEPDAGGKDAAGEIQADGTYTLTTYAKDDGAVMGNHRVSVSGAGRSVPLKYASPAASKIEVEVGAGKAEYPIDLR